MDDNKDIQKVQPGLVEPGSSQNVSSDKIGSENAEPSSVEQSVVDKRPTRDEIIAIRTLLGRLQVDIAAVVEARGIDEEYQVSLTHNEVQLLAQLLGRGLITAPTSYVPKPVPELP
eukprot:CAMPEP_0184022866 /NCGR_PEP_ID=MMETSP0954-20121128/10928_1 /TAXON_ID=627963 /ORGANISM="Aplanochytrium sp, Strain PBS07" /LENGTH=115 /DNA_ID=CAMNT_0026305457 /DNA_START=140 /DNA_END=483 /DNA_ORIENTATION=+